MPSSKKTRRQKSRGERPQPVQLALRQVAAADEDDVLASALRGDRREVAAREEQRERHQRRRHPRAQPDLHEHPEERQDLRRLADEEVVHQHVEHEEGDVGRRPGNALERGGQAPAHVAHEAELVQLAAHGEEHGEPEIGLERSALLLDVIEREHAGGQERAEAAEGDGGEVELQRPRHDPPGDHQHERDGHHLLVPAQRAHRRAGPARAAAGASGVARTPGGNSQYSTRREQQHRRQRRHGRGEEPRAEADLQTELPRDLARRSDSPTWP